MQKIRILSIDYPIEYADLRKQNGCDDTGNIDNLACKIHINSQVNCNAHVRSILLHEVIEALHYRLQLNLPHNTICQLEAGLLQVIRDNPEFVGFLSEEEGLEWQT